MSDTASSPVLSVRNLRKEFVIRGKAGAGRKVIVPVNDVSFDIMPGRTMALVGESGSGKSTLARMIMRLYKPEDGTISIDGTEIQSLSRRELRPLRKQFQMVFQNPLLSFDPSMTIGASIAEVLRLAGPLSMDERNRRIGELLTDVGLSPSFAELKPRGVSGGELQRAALARAISVYPRLLVLDEPTSALDVSIQGQVIALLERLQRERGIAYLFATHDLRVVRLTSHDVMVVYRGQVVERASTDEIFQGARHPYTLSLFAAEGVTASAPLEASSAVDCPLGASECADEGHLVELTPSHWVRCWRGYVGPGALVAA